MKRSWKAGIKKQAVILGIWAAAGALLTGCKAAGGSGAGNRLRPLELSSLEYTGRLELEYAEQFAVDLYQDGFQVLTVADGSRMLLVPEGKEAPEDVPEETAVVYQPVKNIYLAASAAMDMFRALDALDTIRLSGTDADGWYIKEAREAMKSGKILYAGKYSAPDYERILAEGCGLAVENTMISHAPEVREKLESFGIPVAVDYSSYETELWAAWNGSSFTEPSQEKRSRRPLHLTNRRQLWRRRQEAAKRRLPETAQMWIRPAEQRGDVFRRRAEKRPLRIFILRLPVWSM